MFNVCTVYDMVNGTLQIIESTWNEVVCIKVVLTPLYYILHIVY